MIICKYTRLGASVYVPHLDLLRAFCMAIRRTELNIAFSEGFNPHPRLFFNQPMPLGVQSLSEYFCADSGETADEFMKKLNTSLPEGVKILCAANTDTNPNPANMMTKADYEIEIFLPLKKGIDFSYLNNSENITISYESKGKTVEKDVRNMVYGINNTQDKILLTLACGNVNLRADRLAAHLLKLIGHESRIRVTKTAVYDKNGKNLDEIFFNKQG